MGLRLSKSRSSSSPTPTENQNQFTIKQVDFFFTNARKRNHVENHNVPPVVNPNDFTNSNSEAEGANDHGANGPSGPGRGRWAGLLLGEKPGLKFAPIGSVVNAGTAATTAAASAIIRAAMAMGL